MNKYKQLFQESHCLSKSQLLGYVQGNLDKDEVYAIESHLNDCALCNAALDGLLEAPVQETKKAIDQLQADFKAKLNATVPATKPVMKPIRKRSNQWMIAASVLLLFALGGYSIMSYFKPKQESVAKLAIPSLPPSSYTPTPSTLPGEITRIETPTDSSPVTEILAEETPPIAKKDFKAEKVIQKEPVTEAPSPVIAQSKDFSNYNQVTSPALPKETQKEASSEDKVRDNIAVKAGKESKLENDGYAVKQLSEQEENVAAVKSTKTTAGGMQPRTKQLNKAVPSNTYSNNSNDMLNRNNNDLQIVQDKTPTYDKKKIYNPLQPAKDLYERGKYKRAIRNLEDDIEKLTAAEKEEANYLLGLCHARLGDATQARAYFHLVENSTRFGTAARQELVRLTESQPVRKK
jgi:hypothetical protein